MNRFWQKLQPAWLRRLDQRLLRDDPRLWATRIHQVLFFGGLALLIGVGLSLLTPLPLSQLPNPWTIFALLCVPMLIVYGFWLYRLTQFKADRQFGEAGTKGQLRIHLSYFLGIIGLTLMPILSNWTVSQRMAHAVSDQQLSAEINHLNVAGNFFRNDINLGYSESWRGCQHKERCYSRFGIKDWEGAEILREDSVEALFNALMHAPRTEQIEAVEKYRQILAKYNPKLLSISAEEVIDNFDRRDQLDLFSIYMPLHLYSMEINSEANIRLIERAKGGQLDLLNVEALGMMFFILAQLLIVSILLVRAGAKTFWLSVLAVIGYQVFKSGLGILLGILPGGISAIFDLLMMGFLLWTIYRSKHKRWAQVCICLFVFGMPYVTAGLITILRMSLDLFESYQFSNVLIAVTMTSPMLSLIVWHLGLNRQMQRLQSKPLNR